MAREFTSVGVVGLGTMGAGIVEVFARNGIDVVAVEISEAALERGRATLDRLHRPGGRPGQARPRPTATRCSAGSRFAVGLDALHDVDLVIEAVPEHLDLKQRIFAELDRVCKPEAILATNTSSLSRHRDLGRHQPAQPGHRHALLQPRAGDEAGRGGPHRRHRAPTWSPTSRRCARGSARST